MELREPRRLERKTRAAARYANARARGHNHRRALRTLGRAWSRIIWRCWRDRTPYDQHRHPASNS
jgi:hypothetical protein